MNHRTTDPVPASRQDGAGAGKWIGSGEVLGLLFISSRTLQRWRSMRILPYSRIGNKIYYRLADIEKLLESRRIYK